MAVKKILTACGSGIGSSLLMRMNVEKVLKDLGRDDVEVTNSTTSDVQPGAADVFVVGDDLKEFVEKVPHAITLHNIVDKNELKEKLSALFDSMGEAYTK